MRWKLTVRRELWIYLDEEGNRLELGQLIAGNAFVSTIDGLAFFQLEVGKTVLRTSLRAIIRSS
jgi:hypothetical protein